MSSSMLQDPSFGIARDLLPHVHLVSANRYPQKAKVEPHEVTQLLMQAPQIARDKAGFYWTYFDRPENGTVYLTWQPMQQMGNNFASDGYIWPPAEQHYVQEVGNGVMLEMYYHKAGYAYGEPFATHSRRRFRLFPPNAPNPNAPQVDPSLWIVHYGPIDHNERIPTQMIPRDPQLPRILDARQYLQRCGQIQRKDFILSDRVNWPQIPWPRESSRQMIYPGNRGIPQNMAYPTHPHTGAPPSKRARTQGHAAQTAALVADDDEDTSKGDYLDHITPRDVSLARYRQNHEWMEEILSSAYRISQINFSSLGLGLKGGLSGLTEGLVDAPDGSAPKQGSTNSGVRLDPEQAAEFRKRIERHVETTNDEIAQMQAEHEKKLAKFKANSVLTSAEKDLRTAIDAAAPEALHLEGRMDEAEDGASARWTSKHSRTVDDVVQQVEVQLGRRAQVVHDSIRIQDGGYQEPAPEPTVEPKPVPIPANPGLTTAVAGNSDGMSRHASHTGSQNSNFVGDSDMDMGGTAAGLLDQMHTGMSSNSTPGNNFPTPQGQLSAVQSHSATPSNVNAPYPAPSTAQVAAPAKSAEGEDVAMGGNDAVNSSTAPDQGTGSGDWVVVPKGGVTPEHPAGSTSSTNPPTAAAPDTAASAAAISDDSHGARTMVASGAPQVMDANVGNETKQPSTGAFDTNNDNDNDFGSLGDLDTAGDALGGGDLGGDDFMDDSAFGDAFHGVEEGDAGDTDTPAGGDNGAM